MRNLDELRWEQFHIGDIFSVERPSARNKDNYEDGDVPFVASGAISNGLQGATSGIKKQWFDRVERVSDFPLYLYIVAGCAD